MSTIEIHFDEGTVVRLSVDDPILLSMLALRPGMAGVAFRKNQKFVVVQDDGRRRVMSASYICPVRDEE